MSSYKPVADQALIARGFSEQIALIAEMSRGLATTEDLNAGLTQGLALIADYVEAEASSLFLKSADGKDLVCEACTGPVDITGLRVPLESGIVGRTVSNSQSEIVRDVDADPDFAGFVDAQTGFSTKSILCAPMTVKDECIGAVEVINKRGGDHLFDQNDLASLEVLAVSAALAILNARLSDELVDQERVRRELELASEIQRSLLPRPEQEQFPVNGLNIPIYTVSGDFYDFLTLPDGRIWFALGDVSGKGMNAALLMTKTVSLFRCLAKTIHKPGHLMAAINAELCETGSHGMFVTMAVGILDPNTGQVIMTNAGHEPPLLLEHGGETFTSFEADGPPLGIIDDGEPFPEQTFDLGDDALYIFTDGLTEITDSQGDMLEQEGVEALIKARRDDPLGDRLTSIADDAMAQGGQKRDDVTLLVVEGRAFSPMEDTSGGEAKTLLHLSAAARADQLKPFRLAVTKATRAAGFDEIWVQDLVLALDEACQNVIRHAYGARGLSGDMEVTLVRRPTLLEIQLRDFAPPTDTKDIKPRDLDDIRPGGLGTHFINEVMDSVQFEQAQDGRPGNVLVMTKRFS